MDDEGSESIPTGFVARFWPSKTLEISPGYSPAVARRMKVSSSGTVYLLAAAAAVMLSAAVVPVSLPGIMAIVSAGISPYSTNPLKGTAHVCICIIARPLLCIPSIPFSNFLKTQLRKVS